MRHRLTDCFTGLGNPNPALINNNGEFNKIVGDKLVKGYFKNFEAVDFQLEEDYVIAGYEPAYMYEKLLIICIHKIKEKSYIKKGYAWGGWGTGIRSSTRYYSDFKYKSKFVKTIDEIHSMLFKVH